MTGYIILAAFILLTASHTAVFFIGHSTARKAAKLERAEDERRKAESDKQFQIEKENIKQEVHQNAEQEKASLSSGAGGRDRFNRINDSLRDGKN
jgi:hypothetical protein